MKYVGLTDDPQDARRQHGCPADWWTCRFNTESDALQWREDLEHVPGYVVGSAIEAAQHGYTYTITPKTKQ